MPSKSFIALNHGLGGILPGKSKPISIAALVGRKKSSGMRAERMARSTTPVLRITIVNFREALLDKNNYIFGCKGIQDAIARSLGLDDNDQTIDWEFEQVRTRGSTGLLVRIEQL